MKNENTVQPQDVLKFWFGEKPAVRTEWFQKNPAFDEEIRKKFLGVYELARDGKLAHWKKDPESLLALIIVLDQFPRNMFREDARSFATDPLALRYASEGVARRFDKQVLPLQRLFYYLPYEHSEKWVNQKKSVELFKNLGRELGNQGFTEYAIKHRNVIKKFGRFPHRNKVLNRKSSVREQKWIAGGGGF